MNFISIECIYNYIILCIVSNYTCKKMKFLLLVSQYLLLMRFCVWCYPVSCELAFPLFWKLVMLFKQRLGPALVLRTSWKRTFYWTIGWVVCHKKIHHYHCHSLTLFCFILWHSLHKKCCQYETFSVLSEIYHLCLLGREINVLRKHFVWLQSWLFGYRSFFKTQII